MHIKGTIGALRWRISRWVTSPRTRIVRHRVQPGVDLHVYWKKEVLGQGPCASLYIGRDEILRFDCFGTGGHYHVHVREQEKRGPVARLGFGTVLVKEQIHRSVEELLRAREHLRSSVQARICEFQLDPQKLEQAAHWMTESMSAFQKNPTGRRLKQRD